MVTFYHLCQNWQKKHVSSRKIQQAIILHLSLEDKHLLMSNTWRLKHQPLTHQNSVTHQMFLQLLQLLYIALSFEN